MILNELNVAPYNGMEIKPSPQYIRKPITQHIVNHDVEFEIYKKPTTIIVNDINGLIDTEASEHINNEIYTVYQKNFVDVLPSCNCGNYNKQYLEGKVCPKCGSVCKEEDGSSPVMWIRAFDNKPFINVTYWQMIRNVVDKKVDVLRYLSDTNYNPVKKPDFIYGLLGVMGGKRSYTNLLNNFEKILIYLKNIPKFRNKPLAQKMFNDFLWMWKNKKKDILSKYLPITNKKLFVMENTNKGKFINLLVSTTVDVVNGWLYFDEISSNENKMNNLTAKTLSNLSLSTSSIIKDYLAGKKKLWRKQVYGHRVPISFRCTISTKCGKEQKYDVVDLPWSVGMTTYQFIVLNYLVNRYRFKYLDAVRYIYAHVNSYSDISREIFDTMCKESPGGYLWVEMHRNPTLLPGSKGRFRAIIKSNPDDKTVSVPMTVFNQFNADVDGDRIGPYLFKCGKYLKLLVTTYR